MSVHVTVPRFDGKAACAEIGGDEWYPEPGGEGIVISQAARRICSSCEIQAECLKWALDNDEGWGIWGGLTERQRRRIARRGRAA